MADKYKERFTPVTQDATRDADTVVRGRTQANFTFVGAPAAGQTLAKLRWRASRSARREPDRRARGAVASPGAAPQALAPARDAQ